MTLPIATKAPKAKYFGILYSRSHRLVGAASLKNMRQKISYILTLYIQQWYNTLLF